MLVTTAYFGISDPISSLTHLCGAVVFAILGVFLLRRTRSRGAALAIAVYVPGVVFALTMSGAFHMVAPGTAAREMLRRMDHAGIFFLIAATYVPVHVIQFRGFMRWGVLAVVWSAAVFGIVLKTLYFDAIPEWVGLTLYLALGWTGLISGIALYLRFDHAHIAPLIGGALAYTLGALIDFLRAPVIIPGVLASHELFHLFVLAGVAMHWQYIHRAVVNEVVTAPSRSAIALDAH